MANEMAASAKSGKDGDWVSHISLLRGGVSSEVPESVGVVGPYRGSPGVNNSSEKIHGWELEVCVVLRANRTGTLRVLGRKTLSSSRMGTEPTVD